MATVIKRFLASWALYDQILGAGMVGQEIETGKFKTGDGVKPWSKLPYSDGTPPTTTPDPGTGGTGAQGPKGDKGDKGDTGLTGPKGDKGDPGTGGTGSVDLSTYATKQLVTDTATTINTAIGLKADKTALTGLATTQSVSDTFGPLSTAVGLKADLTVVNQALATKPDATLFYPKTEMDQKLNALPKGDTLTAVQTSTGYQYLNGTPVTTPPSGQRVVFIGLATPTFLRDADGWKKFDWKIPLPWTLKNYDGFDDGAALTTPANSPLKANWVGDRVFTQNSTGLLQPTGWNGTTAGNYLLVDGTVLAARQAAELKATAYSNVTTRRALALALNVAAGATGAAETAYTLEPTSVSSANWTWTLNRRESGVTTVAIGDTFVEAYKAAPLSYRAESDGVGGITLLRDGVAVKTWKDTSTTPLTGTLAGIHIYNPSGSSSTAGQAVRGDEWKVYAG